MVLSLSPSQSPGEGPAGAKNRRAGTTTMIAASGIRIGAFLLSTLLCLTVAATEAAAADGARLADSCSSCHGIEGRGGGAIPPLAGQGEDALRERMRSFAEADAAATIMPRLMAGYTQEEIAALAAYFSRVSPR